MERGRNHFPNMHLLSVVLVKRFPLQQGYIDQNGIRLVRYVHLPPYIRAILWYIARYSPRMGEADDGNVLAST